VSFERKTEILLFVFICLGYMSVFVNKTKISRRLTGFSRYLPGSTSHTLSLPPLGYKFWWRLAQQDDFRV